MSKWNDLQMIDTFWGGLFRAALQLTAICQFGQLSILLAKIFHLLK
jgi:hypothetical protein